MKIEDLLHRKLISLNNHEIARGLFQKRILVTGAAGSIGAEIVRQVLRHQPELVVLCDCAESALYDVTLEIEDQIPGARIEAVVANIQNYPRMEWIFKEYSPEIVFHAAAYKHVPLMELHPTEAILTNVLGTVNLAKLSSLFGVRKFVLISTDKAVKPGNVMGASKRIAELYVQSFGTSADKSCENQPNSKNIESNATRTEFITTRLGNVLDTNGSVLPRFRSQIEKGGPVTVTHPEVFRYFMTIQEAAQLVLEAGVMGNGGEIMVCDMGNPVKVINLARQMIRLSGLIPEDDIQIVFTGLRPGERLQEELFNDAEKLIPTHHEKIKIAESINYPFARISSDIDELLQLCNSASKELVINKMKEMVPEYTTAPIVNFENHGIHIAG